MHLLFGTLADVGALLAQAHNREQQVHSYRAAQRTAMSNAAGRLCDLVEPIHPFH